MLRSIVQRGLPPGGDGSFVEEHQRDHRDLQHPEVCSWINAGRAVGNPTKILSTRHDMTFGLEAGCGETQKMTAGRVVAIIERVVRKRSSVLVRPYDPYVSSPATLWRGITRKQE